MALGRAIAWSSIVALSVVVSLPLPAASTKPSKVVDRKADEQRDPFLAGRMQIAQLRQTADQLRLLADRPLPVNAKGATRDEILKHEAWLRQAGRRVHVLATEWEQQLDPFDGAKTPARAADMNTFFESQSATLKTKLQVESYQLGVRSDSVRSAGDAARVVIAKMNEPNRPTVGSAR
jgi:hypothetical protein